MTAINMGAAGGSNAQVAAAGAKAVLCCPFSGPTGSPFEARTIASWSSSYPTNGTPTYAKQTGNYSTGALCTGIGFGHNHIVGPTAPASIKAAGFTDDYDPGIDLPDGTTATTTAILTLIGGGKSTACVNGIAPTVPYEEQPLLGFGNGGSRDAGAGPIFTGFGTKMVTATGAVANGAAVETGWVNRAGVSLVSGQSVFGSSTAASPVVQ
jgi:hypothetical protein